MHIENLIKIFLVTFSLVIATYYIFSLGKLAWFDPYKLEKILSERAKYHPINVYNPKYDWNAIIWMARVFTLVGTLALLALGIGLLLNLIGLIL